MDTYMLLLYGDEAEWANASPEQVQAVYEAHNRFTEAVAENGGKVVGGEALRASPTARTVRTHEAGLVTDGPYAELKEQLGGFYLIQAESMEHAVAIAKLGPEPIVEVRPVWSVPADPPGE